MIATIIIIYLNQCKPHRKCEHLSCSVPRMISCEIMIKNNWTTFNKKFSCRSYHNSNAMYQTFSLLHLRVSLLLFNICIKCVAFISALPQLSFTASIMLSGLGSFQTYTSRTSNAVWTQFLWNQIQVRLLMLPQLSSFQSNTSLTSNAVLT